jgi:hypothetical protein
LDSCPSSVGTQSRIYLGISPFVADVAVVVAAVAVVAAVVVVA